MWKGSSFIFLINLRVKCDCEESILGLAASKVWLPLPPLIPPFMIILLVFDDLLLA